VLKPNEEGKVVILLDTARFVGIKTRVHFLRVDNGKTTLTWILTVTADSRDPPP
jgi:hypothetical protein